MRVYASRCCAAAACVLPCGLARTEERVTPPRVGLVGTGWALNVQRPAFERAGMRVTALFSRSAARATSLAAEHGITRGYDSVEALAAAADVDLVSVACPTSERKRHALAAVAAGKAVLVEKPMALDAAEAEEICAAAERAGVEGYMDFELRCLPALLEARRLLAEGAIGDVSFLEFTALCNMRFLSADAEWSHWNSKAHGGGIFSAIGTHFVDLSRWLLRDEVSAVSCVQAPLAPLVGGRAMTADGYASVQLKMRKRSVPVHMTLSARTTGRPFENRLVVSGSAGSLAVDLLTSELVIFGVDDSSSVFESERGNAWSIGTGHLALALADPATRSGLASLQDGLAVQRVTDCVHASAALGGRWVEVVEGAPPSSSWAEVSLETLRAKQAAFAAARDWDQFHTPRNLLLALVGEVGELAEIFQWKGEVARGLPSFDEAEKTHVGEELSDVLIYVLRLADVCGVDLAAAALRKIELNARKYPADKARGSSAKYTAYSADNDADSSK